VHCALLLAFFMVRSTSVQPTSLSLDRSQICNESAIILPREAKRPHVGMPKTQAVAQPVHERIQVYPMTQRAKCRGTNMRTFTCAADRVTMRA
jgi:hypothetical protein